ncbi:MAG: hemerythrin domain-containing protein [Burkholderiales bacterium]|nr:hemerythrin domain-containing protein [Burkholderiales bacterium]
MHYSIAQTDIVIIGRKKVPLRISPRSRFDQTELIKLGNSEIDAQHDRMFLLADAIVESLVNARADDVESDPLELLQAFIDVSYQHFRFEEDLMRSVDYPRTDAHAKEHSALLTEIAGNRYRFELGHRNAVQITGYLRNWMNRHIDREDRELVDWLKAEAKLTTAIEKRNEAIAAPGELEVLESDTWAKEQTDTVIKRLAEASKRRTTERPHPSPALTRSPLLRQTVGLLSLTLAYLQYYLLDVQLQIASLPSVIYSPLQ